MINTILYRWGMERVVFELLHLLFGFIGRLFFGFFILLGFIYDNTIGLLFGLFKDNAYWLLLILTASVVLSLIIFKSIAKKSKEQRNSKTRSSRK